MLKTYNYLHHTYPDISATDLNFPSFTPLCHPEHPTFYHPFYRTRHATTVSPPTSTPFHFHLHLHLPNILLRVCHSSFLRPWKQSLLPSAITPASSSPSSSSQSGRLRSDSRSSHPETSVASSYLPRSPSSYPSRGSFHTISISAYECFLSSHPPPPDSSWQEMMLSAPQRLHHHPLSFHHSIQHI